MKSGILQFDAFLKAVSGDPHMKNRIILWSFALLVFPAAFLVALGLPLKVACIGLVVLLLPLQFGVFAFSRRKKINAGAYRFLTHEWPLVDFLRQTHSTRRKIVSLTMTHPQVDYVKWEELFTKLKSQSGTERLLFISYNEQLPVSPDSSLAQVGIDRMLADIMKARESDLLLIRAQMQRSPTLSVSRTPNKASLDVGAHPPAFAPI